MSGSELAIIEQLDARYAKILRECSIERLLWDVEWDWPVGVFGLGQGACLACEGDGANQEQEGRRKAPKGTKRQHVGRE
ncbi:hypothetical protein [Sphingobium sp. AS12]|uniref:hypothetical protein n=1 Tax=Sphingobium sp. AS12 TaxID=2849495 RepID=UPI0020C87A93|nr:hypothetical protein [Sphingobium sp. AS12]